MKKGLLLVALVALLGAEYAHASRAYGMAGCGLGSLVFGKDSQLFAATTNGTAYSQLFGISFGTSNCTDNAQSAALKIPAFVESNRVALANDVARGSGDTLASLSQVMGCSDTARVGALLQQNYSSIFPNESVEARVVGSSIVGAVKTDASLAAGCKNII